jgi:bacterioferritin-associated ferredoxin
MIVCLCMGLTDEDIRREIDAGCGSLDDLIELKQMDPKKACRECEEVIHSRIKNKRGRT